MKNKRVEELAYKVYPYDCEHRDEIIKAINTACREALEEAELLLDKGPEHREIFSVECFHCQYQKKIRGLKSRYADGKDSRNG